MIRRCHGNGMNVLVFKCLAHVLNATWLILVLAGDEFLAAFEEAGVGVDEVGNLHILDAPKGSHVRTASPLDAAHG